MDWFERLTGFRETTYEATRARLEVNQLQLRSLVSGAAYRTGELELVSLADLRTRVRTSSIPAGTLKVSIMQGNVRQLHQLPENAGALFQVASQFNLLEMTGPDVKPEDGVTRYQNDQTQGPACAIAAGAATIYRNYFVPVADGHGQTSTRQLDALAALGAYLSQSLHVPASDLWTMRNGYALANDSGLELIARYLRGATTQQTDELRGKLCIGVHSDVEATEVAERPFPLISQAFCSALPVAYAGTPASLWEPFARLVLEAAYEATIWAGALNAWRGASNVIYLTLLGAGAFGNHSNWILPAMQRSLELAQHLELDVRIVTYHKPPIELLPLAQRFASDPV